MKELLVKPLQEIVVESLDKLNFDLSWYSSRDYLENFSRDSWNNSKKTFKGFFQESIQIFFKRNPSRNFSSYSFRTTCRDFYRTSSGKSSRIYFRKCFRDSQQNSVDDTARNFSSDSFRDSSINSIKNPYRIPPENSGFPKGYSKDSHMISIRDFSSMVPESISSKNCSVVPPERRDFVSTFPGIFQGYFLKALQEYFYTILQ